MKSLDLQKKIFPQLQLVQLRLSLEVQNNSLRSELLLSRLPDSIEHRVLDALLHVDALHGVEDEHLLQQVHGLR